MRRVSIDERIPEEALRHREVIAERGEGEVVGGVEGQEVEAVTELVETVDSQVRPAQVLRLRPRIRHQLVLRGDQVHVRKVAGVLEPVVAKGLSGAVGIARLTAARAAGGRGRRNPDAFSGRADYRKRFAE